MDGNIIRTWKVNFFKTARGDSPVNDFIEEQDATTYAKAISYIDLLEYSGPFLKPPYMKKLQDKLYELRISGKTELRILYTISNNEYYLLHVFKKKTQKTPTKEIKIAIDRMKTII